MEYNLGDFVPEMKLEDLTTLASEHPTAMRYVVLGGATVLAYIMGATSEPVQAHFTGVCHDHYIDPWHSETHCGGGKPTPLGIEPIILGGAGAIAARSEKLRNYINRNLHR